MKDKSGISKEPLDLIVAGGTIITQNETREIIPQGALAIKGSTIVAIGKEGEILERFQAPRVIDAHGKYIFPGLINTHTHLFQTMVKGLGEGMSLYQWVDKITAPSAVAMTEREAYLSAILGGLESLHCGATTVLDFMYSLPIPGLYRAVGHAFQDLRLRGILARGLIDSGEQHGLSPCQFHPLPLALEECDTLSEEFSNHLISVALAPEIPFGLKREGFEMVRQYANDRNMLITIHVNEVDDDNRACFADYGMEAVPLLESTGFWGPDVLAVHCVKMQPRDIDIFLQHDVKISHNPVSNMYLGVGIPPILDLRRAGLSISLATDGAGSNNSQDMIETMKCTGLMHKVAYKDASVISAQEILDMATLGGAKGIGQADRIGSLEPQKQADLFLFDPLRAKSTAVLDPVASLVYSAGEENITTTIVAGEVLLDEGRTVYVDEPALLSECQKAAYSLARRVGTDQFLRSL